MKESLLSVGIDLGTSTTQLIFSKLSIDNMAGNFSVPRIEIIDKEVIYRSPIYMTPLHSFQEIDGEGIRRIVEKEYQKANVKKSDVQTGAIIITGETARKENAKDVLETLSGFAGDFVVATAGPDLESVLAGKGAGAHIFSKENNTNIVHIDIGGGTSNLAYFEYGVLKDTGCLDIGGRLLKVNKKTMEIEYISVKLKEIIKRHQLSLQVGKKTCQEDLEPLLTIMVNALAQSVNLQEKNKDFEIFITNKSIGNQWNPKYISFSGGVADFIYEERTQDPFQYGDIGPLLGKEIHKSSFFKRMQLVHSKETVGATVVGAGSHTMEVSGSTIFYTKDIFPLKNLPVLKLINEEEKNKDTIANGIKNKIRWFALEGKAEQVVIAIGGIKNPKFSQIEVYADGIFEGINGENQDLKVLVIVENDMAKALGHALYHRFCKTQVIVCIDNITLENGDYVDLGKPVANGYVLPVVVKTLVFDKW